MAAATTPSTQEVAVMSIPTNTIVRVTTTNGGEAVVTLLTPYRPSYSIQVEGLAGPYWIEADRLASIEALPLETLAVLPGELRRRITVPVRVVGFMNDTRVVVTEDVEDGRRSVVRADEVATYPLLEASASSAQEVR